jgi:predicted DNA-binding transcriptional regulator AlpA
MEEENPFLTQKEVSEVLGVTRQTLWKWRKRDDGPPCKKVGRNVLYPRQKFWAWVEDTDENNTKTGAKRA